MTPMSPRSDDPSIADGEALWRRILPLPAMLVTEPDGSRRPSSAAFLDGHTGEVSVHRAALTSADRVLLRHPGVGLAEVLAGLPRSLGHLVVADPVDGDASHALICPRPGTSNNQRKATARRMALAARWVIEPPPP
jgi:hypothetical protein